MSTPLVLPREAIRLNPNNARYYAERGKVYSKLKKYERALADYGEASRLEPKNAEHSSKREKVYRQIKKNQYAIADIDDSALPDSQLVDSDLPNSESV
jgi:tetratricopeptide (TPR) repeat protein